MTQPQGIGIPFPLADITPQGILDVYPHLAGGAPRRATHALGETNMDSYTYGPK